MSRSVVTVVVSERKFERVAESLEPDVYCLPLPASGKLPTHLRAAQVLLHWGLSLERFSECAFLRDIRWVHTFWAGTEHIYPIVRRFAGTPRFSDSRGTYDIPIAEHTVGLLLGLVRGLHRHRDAQARRIWRPEVAEELCGKRALILGAGSIGSRVGSLLTAFGVDVRGIRRRLPRRPPFPMETLDRLDDRLPRSEVLIVALPETPETCGLLDARRLEALPRGAYLVNVGRGRVLDEEALGRLLREGHLGGAALDVFAEEPLAAHSPLWDCPRIWVSPHCSGLSPAMDERRMALFQDNLVRYRAGDRLRNETVVGE